MTPVIWIDQYGRFMDAFDLMMLSATERRYFLAVDKPHYPVPARIDDQSDENEYER